MLPQEIIRIKRDGGLLTAGDIADFVGGITSGDITEGQAAAFAMAVFFNGMNLEECVALTVAMRDSGDVLTWGDLDLPGPVLDKHSTGGIGDNVSLMLAPMVAATGGFVPMISGRGLGHTGGTLDKLEAIPGYSTQPSNALFRNTVKNAGCAIIGQTGDLAPADKRLYGIRDVTATVESTPLITASILSKKLAAGLGGLVLDVKTGSGAFAAEMSMARELGENMVRVGNGAGLPTTAMITDMNEPLATAAGNAVEVKNAVDFLTNARRDPRLEAIIVALGAEMLVLGKLSSTIEEASESLRTTLSSGGAAERFGEMVSMLGGPADFVEQASIHLPRADIVIPIMAESSGVVAVIDTRDIGVAVVELGGGRMRAADEIDHAVGFSGLAGIGDAIGPDKPLGIVHARDQAQVEQATRALRAAYHFGAAPERRQAVYSRIGTDGGS